MNLMTGRKKNSERREGNVDIIWGGWSGRGRGGKRERENDGILRGWGSEERAGEGK